MCDALHANTVVRIAGGARRPVAKRTEVSSAQQSDAGTGAECVQFFTGAGDPVPDGKAKDNSNA